MDHQFIMIRAGQKLEAVEALLKLKAEAERFSRLAQLAKLREESPAFLWELSR